MRNRLHFSRQVMLAGVALLLLAGAARSLYRIGGTVPTIAQVTAMPTIIIDPGHGGVDGGAVGMDNIVEKDINLSICLTMRDIFAISGFDVVMTRDTDISIHDEGVSGTKKQKTSDLRNRLAIVEENPGAIFISLHQNKFEDRRSKGAQIFYGPKNQESQALAQVIQENFVEDLQPGNQRQIKQAGKNLFLLHNAPCPSVLVECGFLSNPEDAYQLVDPEFQAKIAFTTFRSVMEFLGLDTPPGLPGASSEGESGVDAQQKAG